jgi:hypothetical protein
MKKSDWHKEGLLVRIRTNNRIFVILSLAILLNLLPISPSQAIFGIGDCSKVKKSITPIERSVISNIDYIRGLTIARPSVDGAQGVRLYDKHNKISSDLRRIRGIALTKIKCFPTATQAVINDNQYWTADYYVSLGRLSGRYWIISGGEYLPLKFK